MNSPKRCSNCSAPIIFGARKCKAAGCGASTKFARCETVEETDSRVQADRDMRALLSELTGGAL
tara:strand:+ start:7975 stop:8166 length:192 start_codon:yes stop_codon:yes gene_type:complete